ncbi:MAG TPA: hypothetical protein VKT32_00635 [Chthonomonadaceae bacterium]|nr:hypothetical protein [Chthonomonadaceae bacterium]
MSEHPAQLQTMENPFGGPLPWVWTANKERAAALVAADELADEAIAAEVGIAPRTLRNWKTRTEFAERVFEILEATRQECLKFGVASRAERLARMNRRWEKIHKIIEERAAAARQWTEEHGKPEAPGMEEGLLVRQIRSVGKGESARLLTEYAADGGLLKAALDIEKQAAVETGQWQEKRAYEVSGPGGGPLQVRHGNPFESLSPEELCREYVQQIGLFSTDGDQPAGAADALGEAFDGSEPAGPGESALPPGSDPLV